MISVGIDVSKEKSTVCILKPYGELRVPKKLCKPPLSDKIKQRRFICMAKREKSLMRQLIEERGIKDIAGVQALVKELTAGMIQEAMDAELDEELGYSKYDYKNKQTDNSRNGSYKKTVSSSQGDVELTVPRDRNGEYEPQIFTGDIHSGH